jgi:hypothetical protein
MFARFLIASILIATAQAKDFDDLRPLLAAKQAKSEENHQASRNPEPVAHAQPEPVAQLEPVPQLDAPQADVDDSDVDHARARARERVDADVDDSKPQQDEPAPRKIGAKQKPHQAFGKQTANNADPVMNGLKEELASLKRNKINVEQLQRTESASKALLHEGQEMMRGASSKRSHQAYERQVHESETVEKEALRIEQEGKLAAAEEARAALREATVVQNVAQALATEANTQLRQFAKVVAPVPKASAASSSDEEVDEDVDMD